MILKKKLICLLAMGFSLITMNICNSEKSKKTFSYSPFNCIKEHPIVSTMAFTLNTYGITTLIKNRKFYEDCYKKLFRKGDTRIAQCSIFAGSLLFAITYGRYYRKIKKCEEIYNCVELP
jgi:hypothetical protein